MVHDGYSNAGILRSYTFYHDLLYTKHAGYCIPSLAVETCTVYIFGLMIVRAHYLALKWVVVAISINLPVGFALLSYTICFILLIIYWLY